MTKEEQAELDALRAEQGPLDEYEELEMLRKEQGPLPEEPFSTRAPREAWNALTTPIAKASEFVDSYVGAPMRSMLAETQKERQEYSDKGDTMPFFSTRPLKAAWDQFGEDPQKAPTSAQIAEGYGVSGEKSIPFSTVKNFGSPNARFQETKVSPSEIVGAAGATAIDPVNYIPGAKLVERLGMLGNRAAEGVYQIGVGRPAKRFSTLGAGVPRDVVDYYLENHPRLKGKEYKGYSEIRGDMLNSIEDVKKTLSKAEFERQQAHEALKKAADEKWDEISPKKQVNSEQIEALHNLIDKTDRKRALELDAMADEELRKLPIRAPVSDLQNIIRNAAEEIPADSAQNAALRSKIESMADLLPNSHKGSMSGVQLRNWVKKTLNPMIDFSQSPGNIDELANRVLKGIREEVTESLKKVGEVSPDKPSPFRQIMDKMSSRRKATEAMMKIFGKRKAAQTSLRQLFSNADPVERKHIVDTLYHYADTNNYPELRELVDAANVYRDEYDLMVKEGIEPQLKGPHEQLVSAELAEQQAKTNADSIKRMNDNSIEGVITDLGRPHKGKYANQESLEALEQLSGKNYSQDIRDQGALREFGLDRTRGSKRTTPGAIIGGLGGFAAGNLVEDPVTRGAMMAGAGYAGKRFGEYVDIEGGKLARKALDTSMSIKNSKEAFFNMMQNPTGKFKKYADVINKVSETAEVPARTMLLYHQILWNNDPDYRATFNEDQP